MSAAPSPFVRNGDRRGARLLDARPGLIVAALVFCSSTAAWPCRWIFLARRSAFKSDEATYYMMAHSLAADGDLEYRRADLVRVWREFPSGPAGVFLKKGRDGARPAQRGVSRSFTCRYRPDPDKTAPVLRQVLHVSAGRGAVRVAVRHQRLRGAARGPAGARSSFAGVPVPRRAQLAATSRCFWRAGYFLASVTPGYVVWMTPELFNLVDGGAGVLLLALQGRGAGGAAAWAAVAPDRHSPMSSRRCSSGDGVVLEATQRPADRARSCCWPGRAAAGRSGRADRHRLQRCCSADCSSVNLAVTGDWNFQGGERARTYYGGVSVQTRRRGSTSAWGAPPTRS